MNPFIAIAVTVSIGAALSAVIIAVRLRADRRKAEALAKEVLARKARDAMRANAAFVTGARKAVVNPSRAKPQQPPPRTSKPQQEPSRSRATSDDSTVTTWPVNDSSYSPSEPSPSHHSHPTMVSGGGGDFGGGGASASYDSGSSSSSSSSDSGSSSSSSSDSGGGGSSGGGSD